MARTEFGRHKKVVTGVDDGTKQVSKDEWNDDPSQLGILGFDDVVKTLATGAFTISDTLQVVAAETGTTDDLDTITATDANNNDLCIIRADTGDTITVKSGTGNIELPGSKDVVLVAAQLNYLILIFDGTNWRLPKVLGNSIVDENGNELLDLTKVALAVNNLEIKNAATGNGAELNAVGGDTDIDIILNPKGAGVVRGHRESYGYALSNEDTILSTGVKITTAIWNYDFNSDDVIISVKTLGTGAALVTVDILRETAENSNVFETIFTTKPTIDASEYTSKTAATAAVVSSSLDDVLKGERIQLKIDTIDTDNVATGLKVIIEGHALGS